MQKIQNLLLLILLSQLSFSQITYPTNGPADPRTDFHSFINAKIVVSPTNTIEQGTLVIKEGKVVSVSTNSPPKASVVHDLKGAVIYPSFIEVNSNYGLEEAKWNTNSQKELDGQVFTSTKKGAFDWNEAIHPEIKAVDHFTTNQKTAEQLLKSGFGFSLSHIQDGIARGTGVFVSLGDQREHIEIIQSDATRHFSFSKGSSKQSYPSSLMGAIALLRQTHYDAIWYNNQNQKETNLSLAAWNDQSNLPAIFEANDVLNSLRVKKLSDEIDIKPAIIGNGQEYQRIDALKQTNLPLIVPVDFPKAYSIEDPLDAMVISLEKLKHWEMAPYNCSFLEQKQIPFILTSTGLKDVNTFLPNVRVAVKKGLSEQAALKALTTFPAEFLQVSSKVGSLESGKRANFFIATDNIFQNENAKILEHWTNGRQHSFSTFPEENFDGNYQLTVAGEQVSLKIETKQLFPTFEVTANDTVTYASSGSIEQGILNLFYTNNDGRVRLNGWKTADALSGTGVTPDGKSIRWQAKKIKAKESDTPKESEKQEKEVQPKLEDVMYPFMAYGWNKQPEQLEVLFKNVTIWTGEEDGILEQTDLLIANGKIKKIGKNISSNHAKTIDATGLHLTAGIIDEHSHICISRGVNEATQASSAEVRIGDVVNSEHIALYRVLGGGVTTSQLLHGSANPIGGQSAIIKSRWGLTPEEMKLEQAPEFIKFALGENVKQSNWGPQYDTRYPQTRMGVEQVYKNFFTLAKEYDTARKKDSNHRKNLELEAIAEILNKKRFISCHSYVQSEITMLMNVANEFGFPVNTFTHILEGYKVADKMKAHGVGASTFSDWWAYKYEVIDAIPYNAAILNQVGVVTAINSDDAEMARRLNQEAAKAVKYGGISEEEAWKMVTINPAKLLHIDHRVGSIKEGKDADIVLWSNNPLSIYARALQTYVDGRKYFDVEEEKNMRTKIKAERERIIQLMLNAKKQGKETQKPKPEPSLDYNCREEQTHVH